MPDEGFKAVAAEDKESFGGCIARVGPAPSVRRPADLADQGENAFFGIAIDRSGNDYAVALLDGGRIDSPSRKLEDGAPFNRVLALVFRL